MKTDRVYLEHILDAIEQIESYTSDLDHKSFFAFKMAQDAVARQLEILGEASRQLSVDTRERAPEVPWHAIVGMRNRIVHEYIDIDLDVIWEVVSRDLPALKEQIVRLLNIA